MFLATSGVSQDPQYSECLTQDADVSGVTAFIYNGYAKGDYSNILKSWCRDEYTRPYGDADMVSTFTHRNLIFVSNQSVDSSNTPCNYISPGQLNVTDNLLYCYSQTKGLPGCTLHYSSYLIYIVAACNIMKVTCMFITAKMLWNDGGYSMPTVGDATASFLEFPDRTTQRSCIIDEARQVLDTSDRIAASAAFYERKPRANMVDNMRIQWVLSSLSCIAVVATGTALVIFSNHMTSTMNISSLNAADGMGFVRMNIATNSVQLILSIACFCCNSFISAQCATNEWAKFATVRKPLRVTWPRGQQRSTYWLSLPYGYSVPFIGLFLLIHFVLSQSIYIGRSQLFNSVGENTGHGIDGTVSAIYFNQKYCLVTLGLGFALTAYQFVSTYVTFSNRMPCYGNDSAVISAMCHMNDPYHLGKQFSQQELKDAASKPLIWGVTRPPIEGDGTTGDKDIPGHCSFTSDTVERPIRGQRYE